MRIDLKHLTDRQRQAWQMRYQWGWRVSKIAFKMGIGKSSVSELLLRAMMRAGLPRTPYVRIIRTKPKRVREIYLSQVRNY
jgi:hypothetical protein